MPSAKRAKPPTVMVAPILFYHNFFELESLFYATGGFRSRATAIHVRNFIDRSAMSAPSGSWTNACIYGILSPKSVLIHGEILPEFLHA